MRREDAPIKLDCALFSTAKTDMPCSNQGEADVELHNYGCRFRELVLSWRRAFSAWGASSPALPFLFVQLAAYAPGARPRTLNPKP